ncbi:hypothetical protein BSZ32_04300 [Rubritalea profundi]|uniref:3-hydroxyacyl-CoA dehydrogenase NAD binding domain-containing protein n=1 Tax=Rubritalea profundi TaxID=1658618 RepID=A0A2S7TYH6_9BACT|nr:hypothetical protein BSZ32_04300 [Rubritalea profundi]
MRLFFSSERAKKLRIGEQMPATIDHAAVIGSGVMGSGIAYWLSTRNCHVLLKDINSDALARGMGTIESLYHSSVKRHVLSQTEANAGFDRITASTADLSLNNREIVIELQPRT